jgi:hypothetical protein
MARCRFLVACLGAIPFALAGCAGTGKAPENVVSVSEVRADVRVGAARSFEHCTWYPGAAGFSRSSLPARPLGQLVLREDALLWGDYDMARSVFRVARRLPFSQVQAVYLAQRGEQNMLVVESANGALDSFAIEHPPGQGVRTAQPDPAATREAWRFLRTLLGL